MENNEKMLSVRALLLITTPKLAGKAAELFRKGALPLQYRFNARGTASSEIMDMLGLGGIDKCVLLSILPKPFADVMLHKLHEALHMDTVNSGIAFSVPITGANNRILQQMVTGTKSLEREWNEVQTMEETKKVLIAAIVNRGFSGDVMEAARAAGAGGGSVIYSSRIGNEEVSGFWGISVQEEKEIVLILSELEHKLQIMRSISEACGVQSEAKGLVVSLPIDTAIGV